MSTYTFQMPTRSSPNAPKFNGKASDLIRFFEEVTELAGAASLSDERAIAAALRYAPVDDAETWMTLPEADASPANFDAFVEAVKVLYPGCETTGQYTLGDLDIVIREQRRKSMPTQDDLGEYFRKFLRVSSYLMKKKRLAETTRDRMFLEGFPPSIADRIRRRLEIKQPDIHPDDVYLHFPDADS